MLSGFVTSALMMGMLVPVYGQENLIEEVVVVEENQEETEDNALTLEKSIELALENNFDVKIAEVDKEASLLSRRKLLETAKIDFSTGNYEVDLGIELSKVQKEYLETLAESMYDMSIIGVKLQVKSAYANVIHAQNNYALAEKYLEQAKESYEFTKKRLDLGQIAKTDLLEAESEVATKKSELLDAKLAVDNSIIDLNMLLNQPLDKKWKFEESEALKEVEVPEIVILKEHMEKNHPVVIGSQMRYNIAKTTFDVTKGFYPENVFTHREAKQNFEKTSYEYEATKLNQEKELIQAYQRLDSLKEGIRVLEKSNETISEVYRSAQLRMELGYITSHDLNNIALTQQKMEINLINLRRSYQLAIASLEAVSGYTFME